MYPLELLTVELIFLIASVSKETLFDKSVEEIVNDDNHLRYLS